MSKTISKNDINIGGSAFWILLILLGLMSLIFLLIWSFFNDSIQGAIVSIIFTVMIVAGVLLSRLKVFDLASWGANTVSFSIGFFLYMIIGAIFGEQSIIGTNYLFATLSTTLPQIIEVTVNTFLIPIAEELVWMIGLPFALITIMNSLGKDFPIWTRNWLQLMVLIVVCSTTFAVFHQGKLLAAFVIASIIFRSLLILLVYGDQKFDLVKGVNLVAAFSVGAHMANNLVYRGVSNVWLLLQNNIWPVGAIIIVFFSTMFISAIVKVINHYTSNRKTELGA